MRIVSTERQLRARKPHKNGAPFQRRTVARDVNSFPRFAPYWRNAVLRSISLFTAHEYSEQGAIFTGLLSVCNAMVGRALHVLSMPGTLTFTATPVTIEAAATPCDIYHDIWRYY